MTCFHAGCFEDESAWDENKWKHSSQMKVKQTLMVTICGQNKLKQFFLESKSYEFNTEKMRSSTSDMPIYKFN